MRFSTVVASALAALSLGATTALAAPLEPRQTVYTPIPDILNTTAVLVASAQADIRKHLLLPSLTSPNMPLAEVQITAKAYALLEADLAAVAQTLTDAKPGLEADVGLALSALLGVVTYEEGVVKLYADIIVVRLPPSIPACSSSNSFESHE